ncbi:GNAT family N-acetyltransferase [Psychromonas arctica]|uniref:GNAT family N-acetyltransferase n=1 Tax=Psychromonas arctica TaxID=168275 RepID=A0ABU9H799_9GAMM
MDLNSLQFSQLQKEHIPLVNQFYKQVYKKGLANKSEQVFVLKTTQILCAARLKEVQGSLLLTGVACLEEHRKQGLASLLITHLLTTQQQNIYCFPYPHLQVFYKNLGFTLYEPAQLPEKLGVKYQRYNSRKPLLCMIYSY